ncbi:Hypothetical protein CINCED_3A007695 [Cinara cedri]|uniref:Uncharacterized protein n=1 Tax=Cinara cedri TaxID=506608 RepID=A0A5E4M9J3_9HEMI|nr:Hypothetical protein CINCED_3A007695 [Cinara cedri]
MAVSMTSPSVGSGAPLSVSRTVTDVLSFSGQGDGLFILSDKDDALECVVLTLGRKWPNAMESPGSESESNSGANKYARLESLGWCIPTAPHRLHIDRLYETNHSSSFRCVK